MLLSKIVCEVKGVSLLHAVVGLKYYFNLL